MSALFTALLEGETKESLAEMVCELRAQKASLLAEVERRRADEVELVKALERAIERIIQDACELPDRTSPEDQPEMLLITGEELDMLLRRHLGLEDRSLLAKVKDRP